ncbi:hypothetical protein BU26DRAFT_521993 [Trematosphaeria pertusa]|uniref:Uncharacterized protein n=1 Tax=Trematosphaeria pertusa TaxID=390896 RepID=A0A6A6I5H8_9PLEO|nr:uncharacterized protein BU26DRAFT_521993 [Trematosphaeria pertusa]KAF2245576.1 hypothetical protein BU26DRAFT_521993 [Trematosphaeria pertusa]
MLPPATSATHLVPKRPRLPLTPLNQPINAPHTRVKTVLHAPDTLPKLFVKPVELCELGRPFSMFCP